jgi:circadian clock protein KaiC
VTERVKTGIADLDEMLGGGFLAGDCTMLVGGTGTGKTTLALQCLVNGVNQFNQNSIFVTFEQMPDQIYRDAKSLGWDLPSLERENKFRVICTSPDLLIETQEGENILDEPIRQIRPQRIAIDSLSHLGMYLQGSELRREGYRLTRYLKTKGLSSMFTWESHELAGPSIALTNVGMSFLVDCIISLRFVEIESSMRKALAIIKLRGSDHDRRLREYDLTSTGIRLGAPFSQYEGLLTGSPRKSFTEETARGWARAFGGKGRRST